MRLLEIESSIRQQIKTFPFMKKNFIYDSSTLQFQNKSGIKVAQDYNMPEGLAVEDVYKYYSSILRALDSRGIKTAEYRERVNFLHNSILSINPNLQEIVNASMFDNAAAHVIIAALSRFNIDDIKSYVVDGKSGSWYIRQPDYKIRAKMQKEIESLTDAPIYWIMSNKTLKRVYSEVVKKYKKSNTTTH